MYILGISAFYHDSAACLIHKGSIIAAAQEERFTRIKHDSRFPKNAISYCLKEAGIKADDIENVVKVLKSGSITQGPKIVEFEKKISKFVKSKYAVAVSSCTAGLHLSLLATGIKDKKKVITSPITFVSTANSIKFCGNKIILEDVICSKSGEHRARVWELSIVGLSKIRGRGRF